MSKVTRENTMSQENSRELWNTQSTSKNCSKTIADICDFLEVIEASSLATQAVFQSSTQLIQRLNAWLELQFKSHLTPFPPITAGPPSVSGEVPRQLEDQLRRISNHINILRHRIGQP
jgi:hypothetical protein